ncbi:MAG TPA: hypothetical protein VGF98_01430 [Candidatus Tumulicola sp.]
MAAIRRDLSILMSAEVQYVRPLVIEWVVTDGRHAMASWVARPFRGFATLAKREGRWWWTGETVGGPGGFWTNLTAPPQDLGKCFDSVQSPPSAKAVFDDGYIDKSTYMLLRGRWRTVRPSALREVFCDGIRAEDWSGNYRLRLDPPLGADGSRFDFGDPASQRRTDLVDREGHYDFDLSARAYETKKPLTMSSLLGAQLTLWAPFVLDTTKLYTLDLPGVQPPIVALKGTLRNNTISFALPQFTIRTGNIVRGTIAKGP